MHLAAGHTDQQLSSWVRQRVAGAGMPAFEGTLSDEEIWHVINFIRTLAPLAP